MTKHQDLQMFCSRIKQIWVFFTYIVGRGSETQFQVGEFLLMQRFNPLTANSFNWNFHPLEVVSRWRDSQLQVSENYSDLTKLKSTILKCIMSVLFR